MWRFPVETASQSEGGFERTYQASMVVPVWRDVTLSDGKPFEAKITLDLVTL
jgi:alpha-amylase